MTMGLNGWEIALNVINQPMVVASEGIGNALLGYHYWKWDVAFCNKNDIIKWYDAKENRSCPIRIRGKNVSLIAVAQVNLDVLQPIIDKIKGCMGRADAIFIDPDMNYLCWSHSSLSQPSQCRHCDNDGIGKLHLQRELNIPPFPSMGRPKWSFVSTVLGCFYLMRPFVAPSNRAHTLSKEGKDFADWRAKIAHADDNGVFLIEAAGNKICFVDENGRIMGQPTPIVELQNVLLNSVRKDDLRHILSPTLYQILNAKRDVVENNMWAQYLSSISFYEDDAFPRTAQVWGRNLP